MTAFLKKITGPIFLKRMGVEWNSPEKSPKMGMKKYRLAPINGSASGGSHEGTVQGAPSTGFSRLQAVCRGLIHELHALMLEPSVVCMLLCIFLHGKCKPVEGHLKQSKGNKENLDFLQRVVSSCFVLAEALLWATCVTSSFLSF